jgi:hypothetical protein
MKFSEFNRYPVNNLGQKKKTAGMKEFQRIAREGLR